MGSRLCLLVAALLFTAAAYAQDPDWIHDDGRVVELLLAHRDTDRVDGGTLRVERERRVLAWTGAPNEIGCRRPWEVSFDDVDEVKADEPGFVLRLRRAPREVRLAPLPHFSALVNAERTQQVTPSVREAIRGPDKESIPFSGAGASTTPTLKRRMLAPEVQRDSARAVEAVLAALSRRG
jgi:hypothetical protein